MVEVVSVNAEKPDPAVIRRAADLIGTGGLVIYPTETVYGLAADASSDEATAEVFRAKSRPLERPISVAVDSLSMAYQVGKLSRREEDLIQKFLPGPLTVLVETRPSVSDLLSAGTGKVGVRIPDHPVALELVREVGGPITSTSSNISDHPTPTDIDEALEQVGEYVELAMDSGPSSLKRSSTVVDVTDDIEIFREGPISESTIRSFLE